MNYSPEEFVQRTFVTSLYMGVGLLFIVFMFLTRLVPFGTLFMVLLIGFPIIIFVMFSYFIRTPDVKIRKIEKAVNKEIVFAGRFLIVELESGVTLYKAMKNMGASFQYAGAYFEDLIDKVDLGTPLEEAISETILLVPSASLRKIFWQISNSIRTGSDISKSLYTVVENMVREQKIEVQDYGRRLNPLAMFYMLIAVIVPSLGITLLTVVSLFMGLELSLPLLLAISGMLGFVQFMFVAIINSSRPAVEF